MDYSKGGGDACDLVYQNTNEFFERLRKQKYPLESEKIEIDGSKKSNIGGLEVMKMKDSDRGGCPKN